MMMTRKDRDEIIRKLEDKMPSLSESKTSPFLSGMREAYLCAIMFVIETYYEGDSNE